MLNGKPDRGIDLGLRSSVFDTDHMMCEVRKKRRHSSTSYKPVSGSVSQLE